MSVITRRAITTVSVETVGGFDGQGKPSYSTPFDVLCWSKDADEVIRTAAGDEVRVVKTLYVPNGQTQFEANARITHSSETFVVVEKSEGRKLDTTLDHVRYRCREE